MPQKPARKPKAPPLRSLITGALRETTHLNPAEERVFRQWADREQIRDVDHPDSYYDYRGYWKDIASRGDDRTAINAQDQLRHFPDTYKQHGHPSFSQESGYSRGPYDGGMWVGETLLPPPKLVPSH